MLLRLRPRRDSTSPKCIEVLGTDSVRFRGDALQAGDNATFTLDGVFGETCTQVCDTREKNIIPPFQSLTNVSGYPL